MRTRIWWTARVALWSIGLWTAVAVTAPADAATVPFTYRRGAIPDLDQQRQIAGGHFGLPGDGVMYCAPTSAMDCLAYIANHGYGWMEPNGPRDWQSPTLYDVAGIEIFKMGHFFMGTDPATGTTGGQHVQGLKDWLDSWGLSSDFTVNGQFASGSSCPTPNDLADAALQGGLVMPIIGWYTSSVAGSYSRSGGHVLAMNKLVGAQTANGVAYTITWRDPASDDGSFTSQSPFRADAYTLTAVSGTFDGNSRTQYQVNGFNSGSSAGFLDGYVVITPKYALTTAPGDFEFDLYDFSAVADFRFHTPAVAALGGVHHAFLHPSMSLVTYATIPDGNYRSDLRVLDPLSGDTVLIDDQVYGEMGVVVSRHRRAYVLDNFGTQLRGLDLDQLEGPYVADMPQYMNTVAYDDLYDLVYVLCTFNTRLIALPSDLSYVIDIQLPPGIVISGAATMSVSPRTSNVWITSQWASALYELGVDSQGVATLLSTVSDPDLGGALGLAVDDQDHVFVSTDTGAGLEFARGQSGDFERVVPSILDGLSFGPLMAVSFSRTNFDPATMIGPQFNNVVPTDFGTAAAGNCPGDGDCDGHVGFSDIDFFVAAIPDNEDSWAALYAARYNGDWPPCDFLNNDCDGDGHVNFADIDPFVALIPSDCP